MSKSSSRESTPNPDIPTLEQEPRRLSRDVAPHAEEKENIKKSPTKSPPRSSPKKLKSDPKTTSPSKSPKKGPHGDVPEEPMSLEEQTAIESQIISSPTQEHWHPTPMKEPRELEPLTPLIINDISVTDHDPQATSTPAVNGIISTGDQPSSPPLSECSSLFTPLPHSPSHRHQVY